MLGRKRDVDGMRLRQDVVLASRAPGIAALADRRIAPRVAVALEADGGQRLRGPAEPRLLVARAPARRASVRRGAVLAVRVVEAALGPPDDVGGYWRAGIATHLLVGVLMQGE